MKPLFIFESGSKVNSYGFIGVLKNLVRFAKFMVYQVDELRRRLVCFR